MGHFDAGQPIRTNSFSNCVYRIKVRDDRGRSWAEARAIILPYVQQGVKAREMRSAVTGIEETAVASPRDQAGFVVQRLYGTTAAQSATRHVSWKLARGGAFARDA